MLRSGRSRRRHWVVGGVVVAIFIIVLAEVVAASRTGGPSYRTASVERADVDATLDSLGTIQPINEANLSFPIAGNVRSVSAAVGQHVTVGQTLAQLDTTSLDAQVASAQATVAIAQARLAADESSQTPGTSTTAVAPAAFITETTGPSDPTSAARELVTKQQARLLADQHRAEEDIATEQHDLKAETSLCQAFLTSANGGTARTSPNPDRSGSSSSAAPATTPPPVPESGSAVPESGSAAPELPDGMATPRWSDSSGCESALQTVLADQVAVDHAQQVVTTDMPALDDAVDKLLTSLRSSAQPQPLQGPRQRPSDTTGSPTGGAARSGRATGSPAGGANRAASSPRPASAEQLASDQAAIDAAQAQLAEAQQAHDQAELHSPIDGTVGSVTISAGQSVPGSSGTPQIVVIGEGSHQVITSVSDANVGSVRVGDAATVTPSGSSAPLRGQVVSIGLLASSGSGTSSGSVSYPITIGLTNIEQQLSAGQSASVSIMLAHASGTLTVPSSAVHTAGGSTIVTVLRDGTPHTVQVTLGAIGPTRTQVLAGLNPGDQVILADLSQPLPTVNLQNVRLAGRGGGPGG
ncbi:MAG: HlyD family efflux transporter periplasmic adaptor subunit [Pseudonocardiales bacterium]|nr:HlyD family efflux transporter periplasmic adaptor subunit [Pseudonocardiales bacterium]MBV9730553.1 HlyD family efflux transporter periplasmic adaptor subunit [Pseudonocardiales bacterium]